MTVEGKICGSKVSIAWVRDTLKKLFKNEEGVLVNWEAEAIGVGEGFVSHIFRVNLTWKGSGTESLPASVVLKVPTLDFITKTFENMEAMKDMDQEQMEQMQKFMGEMWLPQIHRNECNFFDLFNDNPILPLPKSFGYEEIAPGKMGALMMEDMGYGTIVNVADGLRFDQAEAVVRALASLHAYSIRNQGKWEDLFAPPMSEQFEEFSKNMGMMIKNLHRMKPEYFPTEKLDKLTPMCNSEAILTCINSYKKLGLPPVIVEADLWTNNIIFQADLSQVNRGGDRLLAIIDWQYARPGSLGEDLCRLLVSSCSSKLRREHTDEILKHYFDELTKEMKGQKLSFGLEDVKRAFQSLFPFCSLFFMAGLNMWFAPNCKIVEGENKEAKVEELLERGKAVLEDFVAL